MNGYVFMIENGPFEKSIEFKWTSIEQAAKRNLELLLQKNQLHRIFLKSASSRT